MCFSATASFITSAATGAVGAGAMKRARKPYFLIALIPLIFSVQQLIEGLIWITEKPGSDATILGYFFLFFAFIWWPIYAPVAVHSVEKGKIRRFILKGFILLGMAASAYLLAVLYVEPLAVEVMDHSIYYNIDVPLTGFGIAYYIFVTVGSLIVSSEKYFWLFGLLVLISAIISLVFYLQTFTSVWCFFVAMLSFLVYFYIASKTKQTKKRH